MVGLQGGRMGRGAARARLQRSWEWTARVRTARLHGRGTLLPEVSPGDGHEDVDALAGAGGRSSRRLEPGGWRGGKGGGARAQTRRAGGGGTERARPTRPC